MKALLALALAMAMIVSPVAEARRTPHHAYTQTAEPNETDLQSHRHYANRAGQIVHSPSKSNSGKVPAGASAQCRDGSYSFSRSARGTCSHHGGVSTWQ